MRTEQLHFLFPAPKIPTGTRKNHLATLNNIQFWYRWNKTQIKSTLQAMLRDHHIPLANDRPYRYGKIVYRIHRENTRIIDSDAFGFTNKWVQDLFVIQGYLSDDDQVMVILLPAFYESDQANDETLIEVTATFADEPFVSERSL